MLKMPRSHSLKGPHVSVCLALSAFYAVTSFTPIRAQKPRGPQGATGAANSRFSQRKKLSPLKAATGSNGSRVTVTSDSPLYDYSAYRSGDRFYVVIPESDAPGVQSGLRGKGYEDVQVQKRGTDTVLSFHLQPGAAAHVDQKFNKLNIDISTPTTAGTGADLGNSYPQTQGDIGSSRETRVVGRTTTAKAATERLQSGGGTAAVNGVHGDGREPEAAADTAGSLATLQAETTAERSTQASPSKANEQPGGPLTGGARSEGNGGSNPATQSNTNGAESRNRTQSMMNSTAGIFVAQNWPWLAPVGVLLSAFLVFLFFRSRKKPHATASTEVGTDTQSSVLELDQAVPVMTAGQVIQPQQKVSLEEARPLDPDSEDASGRSHEPAHGIVTPPMPPSARAEVSQPSREVTMPRDFERAEVEVRRLLAGDNYDLKVVDSADAGMRQFVATELFAAIGSRHASRRAMALNAVLKHGYFDEATRNLRIADAQAERAASARALGLVRDQAATPHLIAALDDPSPDVRRAVVEALAELKDPTSVQPLEELLQREHDRKVPRSLIQRAIEASLESEPDVAVPPVSEVVPAEKSIELVGAHEAEAPTIAVFELPAIELPVFDEVLTGPDKHLVGKSSDIPEPDALEWAEQDDELFELEQTGQSKNDVVDLGDLTAAGTVAELNETLRSFADSEPSEPSGPLEEAIDVALELDPLERPTEPLKPLPDLFSELEIEAPIVERVTAASPEVVRNDHPAEKVEPVTSKNSNVTGASTPHAAEVRSIEPVLDALSLDDIPLVSPEELLKLFQQSRSKEEVLARPTQEAGVGEGSETLEPTISTVVEDPDAPALEIQQNDNFSGPAVQEIPMNGRALDLIGEPASATAEPYKLDVETGTDFEAKEADLFSFSDLLQPEPRATLNDAVYKSMVPVDSVSNTRKGESSRHESTDPRQRAAAVELMARSQGESAFPEICEAFDDSAVEVRNAAALALYGLNQDRASSFTRALREGSFDRRRRIGTALATSGLAADAIGSLVGEGRDKTYEAFSLLFLMSKAGEVQPLVRAVEEHPDQEVRLAVVRLLALSGQQEILPYFRRLAVRGSLPTEVRSAVMEAVYQISNQLGADTHSTA
jgi:HEAT repeat protein